MSNITIDMRPFLKAVKKVQTGMGEFAGFVVADQMALWGKDLVRSTVPTNKFGNAEGSDWQIGKNAVRKDMEKIFEPIENPAFIESMKAETGAVIYRGFNDGGQPIRIFKDTLMRSASNWYEQHRKINTGRTWMPKAVADVAWGGKKPISQAEFGKFVKRLQSHVGITKAGWVKGMLYHCGRTSGHVNPTIRGYGWVFNHPSMGGGDLKVNKLTLSGFGWIENRVPWIDRFNDGLMAATMATRLSDLNNKYYQLRMQRVFNKAMAA